jgi:hypothetical protein
MMNSKQLTWWTLHNNTMEAISEAWCHDRTLAYKLYTHKFRNDIHTAATRLGIDLAEPWDADGWDGEKDPAILKTGIELQAIRMKCEGKEIPKEWFISKEQDMEIYLAEKNSRKY